MPFFVFFFFCFLYFFTWKKEYMFWYTFGYAGGWVIKKFSPDRFSETKLLFSWPEKLAPKIRSTHVEVFCKKGGRKLRKIHSKTPVPESLFYIRRDSGTSILLWILRNFQEYLFYRTPPGVCFWKVRIQNYLNNIGAKKLDKKLTGNDFRRVGQWQLVGLTYGFVFLLLLLFLRFCW